jgi:hypothetical protein
VNGDTNGTGLNFPLNVKCGDNMNSTEVFIKWLVHKYMPRYRLVSRDLLNEYARQWRKNRKENNEKKATNQG